MKWARHLLYQLFRLGEETSPLVPSESQSGSGVNR